MVRNLKKRIGKSFIFFENITMNFKWHPLCAYSPKPLASGLVAIKVIANIYINYPLTAQPNKPINMQGYLSQLAVYRDTQSIGYQLF
jgi:hypothetical protein